MSIELQVLSGSAATPADCPPLPPRRLSTLVDIAGWRAECQPADIAFTFLSDGEQQEAHLSYAALDRRARAIAAELTARRARGQRVLVVFDPGLEYSAAIFGCLYAGAVAVPVYPPDPFRAHNTLPRLQAIVDDARARLVLTSAEMARWAASVAGALGRAEVIAAESIPSEAAEQWKPPTLRPDDIALLQYTSGSTGVPRGVIITHANLMHNLAALHRVDMPGAVAVCWLPPYHDMGLVGGIMLPVHSGRQVVLLSPLSFVQRPVRWLQAIARYGARTSAAPNFGYELCIRKVDPQQCQGLDLSCWLVAISGAEPVRAETIERFSAKFAPYGFRRQAFFPAYGMAESTLLISCGTRGDGPLVCSFSAAALGQDRVQEAEPTDSHACKAVGCGKPLPDGELLIVDPRTRRPLPPGQVGEIWVRSPSVAVGYWNRPEETQQVFHATLADEINGGQPQSSGPDNAASRQYLRTGDLGFVHDGQLFVTGRLKEVIILGGRKYYPQDIELVAERAHPALKPGGGAAFSVEVDNCEQLVVVHELLRPRRYNLDEVLQQVRAEVAAQFDTVPYAIVLIPAGTLPKTSSGKTRRRSCREMFLKGRLTVLAQWRRGAAGPEVCSEPEGPPRTAFQSILGELWCEVLGLPAVRLSDDFFALGGQSLQASQLAARIQERFGVEVPLRAVFEHPRLADMAQWIEGAVAGSAAAAGAQSASSPAASASRPLSQPLRSVAAEAPSVLSSAEQRLWFFDQLQPNHPFYNMPVAVRLKGPLNISALRRALEHLVQRHEALRTCYPADFGRPARKVLDGVEVPFEQIDLGGWTAPQREKLLRRILGERGRDTFDLAHGPLLRCLLIRLAPEEHVLLLAMHHIIVDGWSLGVILREWALLYQGFCAGRPVSLPPLALQYSDYACWEQRTLEAAIARHFPYWQEKLTPLPPILELPADRPRPTQQSFEGAWLGFALGEELSAAIRGLAHSEHTTLLPVLLAAFSVLLSRATSEKDIAVGTMAANRPRPELEPLVGFFANTLVLRTDVSDDPSFRQLIRRVHRLALEAYDHQHIPFDKLVELLPTHRNAAQAPLFQTALVLENMPLRVPAGLDLEMTPVPVDNGTAKYDLALLVSERGGQIVGQAEYRTALFNRRTVRRYLDALRCLLSDGVANPDTAISRLRLMDPEQRRQIVAGWTANRTAQPPPYTLHELFEAQAARQPHKAAIRQDGRQLTYAQLSRLSDRVAQRLLQYGLPQEQAVGVCVPRSAALVAVMLAVMKAGGAYLPLAPRQPLARLELLIEDSSARLVVADDNLPDELAARLSASGATVLPLSQLLEQEADSRRAASAGADNAHNVPSAAASPEADHAARSGAYIGVHGGTDGRVHSGVYSGMHSSVYNDMHSGMHSGAHSGQAPQQAVQAERLAYIMYTSGSTGRPKGAMVEHRAAVNFVRGFSQRLAIKPDDRVLAFFSPSSDGSLSDAFSALANGACLIIADDGTIREPEALEQLLIEEDVTVATLTPSVLALLRPERLPRLRTVCSVGEPLSAELARRWAKGRRLFNGYGLTETAIGLSLARLSGSVCGRPPIGKPLDNVHLYLLDEHLQPVPPGWPGEICVGGVQVGRGYWNRPELTAARFVPDPLLQTPGARMYRTGDLGRALSDGSLELLGRSDQQVKIRGYRVELGEIAAVLEEHPAVTQAAVIVQQEDPAMPRLVAYVAARPEHARAERATTAHGTAGTSDGGSPASSRPELSRTLLAYLRGRLPSYMVPTAVVVLDALPFTSQGKLDRNALPPADGRVVAGAGQLPRTENERLIAQLWEELLRVPAVTVRDDFFELGGHSLLAVRMMGEIERRTGRRLPLAALFQEPTVEHLAQMLEQPYSVGQSVIVPLATMGKGTPLFCFHPAGGTVFCYRALASHLGEDRPVYGVQAVGVDGLAEPFRRIDEMVRCYAEAIRSVQPQGPYLLAGWSLGGNLAMETARRLIDQGQQIALLALFDTAALYEDRAPQQSEFLPMLMALFPDEENLPLEKLQQMTAEEQLAFFLRRAAQGDIVADGDPAAGQHVFQVFRRNMEAMLQYRQKPYPGEVTLFLAEHQDDWFGSSRDPLLGWGRWAQGGVEVHHIAASHIRMVLEPAVRELAGKLRQCLLRAERRQPAASGSVYDSVRS